MSHGPASVRPSGRLARRALLSLLAVALATPAAADPVTVRLAPGDADFPNPERGFYRAAPVTLDVLDRAWLDEVSAAGTRLVYARIDLSRHRDSAISDALLTRLDAGFAAARTAGVKLIVRATYNYPRGETGYQSAKDAPLPRVLAHLDQLKPLFARNADAIAVVQAGFIGAWGEWHTSSNGLTTPAARVRVRDALLAAVPESLAVQFRYPPDLAAWMPAGRRVGFHNDCFLASQTDVGTYPEARPERDRLRARMATLTAEAPYGGETCNPADDPGAVPRTGCDDILREGAAFHLSYLNADYYRPLFHDRWSAGGCMDKVRRAMGYRLTLLSVEAETALVRGGRLRAVATIRNDGWARPMNSRTFDLVLVGEGGAGTYRVPASGADAWDFEPSTSRTARLEAALPAAIPPGRYRLAIALPEPGERGRRDPRAAIRFANADMPARGQYWNEGEGAFVTGTPIDVR